MHINSRVTDHWHGHILKVFLDIKDRGDAHVVDRVGGYQEVGRGSQDLCLLVVDVLSYGQSTESVARVVVVTRLARLVYQASSLVLRMGLIIIVKNY